jgi:hypothetical protein
VWSWSNLERAVRLTLATGAGVRELFFHAQAQTSVLLFILAALGLPEALRLLAHLAKTPEAPE